MYKSDCKKCIADFRMRSIEKEYIKSLGYGLIENKYNSNVYDEISSHIDIHYLEVKDKLVVSKCAVNRMKSELEDIDYITGDAEIGNEYPLDIPYNVCIMGNKAIHNFKYTDKKVIELLDKYGYTKINVEQGYTKCSIAVIDDNSCITSDIGIAKVLIDKGIDVLLVSEPDIYLLKRTNTSVVDENKMYFEKSNMQGFIGGAMARIKGNIVVFGDVDKFINSRKIREFIEKRGLNIVDFKGLDIIDYGSVVVID